MPIHTRITDYLQGFGHEKKEGSHEGKVTVNDAVSALAFFYERIRNAMEYQDEHLIRQSAIRRILGRRMMFQHPPAELAESLVRELVRSRYLPNNSVSAGVIKDVEALLGRYLDVLVSLKKQHLHNDKRQDWLLTMAACALDELFAPMRAEEGLVRLMADVCEPFLQKSFPRADERIKKGQLIVACYRILLRPNIHRLNYFLLKTGFPAWINGGMSDSPARAKEVPEVMERINAAIAHPFNIRMQGFFRRFRIAFIVLHSIIKQKGESIVLDEGALEQEIKKTCDKMYTTQRQRLTSRTIHAFIYIFLTKMVLGLAVEIPYDTLTAGHIKMKPLLLNILFPPFVLAAISFSVRMPTTANTNEIIQGIKEIVFLNTPQKVFAPQRIPMRKRNVVLATVFNILYLILSIISIGLFAWVLHKLDFNAVSGFILFLFLSLVMFFGITLRRMISDLVILKNKERFFWLFVGQFFDPIMRLGQWLAFKISRINVLVFVFDVLIELPFQAFVDITEEWFAFLREKKDDLERR